ncbi:hypothetical protein [Corynebacterium pacaense]|uniref:hypothetical protein n=1 Tax=Corynebacterium pacaense TaxID=1816684 RepID=UPI0009BA5E5C|nr:hypothetical protein [Corynebacterium pacaense]
MDDIERRSGSRPAPVWQYIPAGLLIALGRALMESSSPWLAGAVLALGLLALLPPLRNAPRDIDSWKLGPVTDGDRKRGVVQLIAPATVLAVDASTLDTVITLPPTAGAALIGGVWGLSVVYSASRMSTLAHRRSRERVRMILARASLDSVDAPDLDAIDRPEVRRLIRALLAHGAIDGTRVMARQLARVLQRPVAEIHLVVAPLEKRGIISRSAIMAGGDPGKVFVELTEKGVVLMKELSAGR